MKEQGIHTIFINQPFGVGDYLMCNSIAQDFFDEGYNVLWGIETIYATVTKHFPNIKMVDKNLTSINYNRRDDYIIDGMRVIPLRFTDTICKVPYKQCMQSKYMYFGKDWNSWKENCRLTRYEYYENKLFYEVLGLKDGEEYNLTGQQFTMGGFRENKIEVNNGLKNVYMKVTDGFTLIDWMKVIENATTINVVASSNIYLFELFPLKAKEINIYLREPIEKNHDNYSYLLTSHTYNLK